MQPYYQDDSCTIYHGDCRDVAGSLEPRSVDALITDPPYGMAFVSGWTVAKATVRSDGIRQGARVVRSGLNALQDSFSADMHALLFCHWESWPDFYDNLCHLFPIRNALIWSKGGGGMGDLRHEYAKDYEIILFGARSRARELNGSRVGAVLNCPRVPGHQREVPFEKPVALLSSLVGRHTPEGGLVLDPFMGDRADVARGERPWPLGNRYRNRRTLLRDSGAQIGPRGVDAMRTSMSEISSHKTAVMYALHLSGGGADVACNRCLGVARGDHAGSVVSVARINSPTEQCGWCGILQGEAHWYGKSRRDY